MICLLLSATSRELHNPFDCNSAQLLPLFFTWDEVTLEDLVEPDQLAEMERDDKKWVLRQRIKELENEIRANGIFFFGGSGGVLGAGW